MKTAFSDPANLARYMRFFLGMTQKELARACGLNLFSISNYENGRSKLQIGNLCRPASFFDISADDLIRNNFRAAMPKLSGPPVRRAAAERHLLEYRRSTYENGRAGERLVARRERERLKGTEFEDGVNEGFADDPTAGYDVSSFDPDGTTRILEIFQSRQLNGDAYLPIDRLYAPLGPVDYDEFLNALSALEDSGDLCREEDRVYSSRVWSYEDPAAAKLDRLLRTAPHAPPELPSPLLAGELILTAEQRDAVRTALSQPLTVILGDPNQLPAVGAGNVLSDLEELGFPVCRLTQNHRQAGSGAALYHNVVNFRLLHRLDDGFHLFLNENPAACREALVDEAVRWFRQGASVQVLAHENRDVCVLNRRIQNCINPPSPDKPAFWSRGMRVLDGDRVMVTRNDAARGVVNGDIGTLGIDRCAGAAMLSLPDGRTAQWAGGEKKPLVPAYAVTVQDALGFVHEGLQLVLVCV